MKQTGVVVRLEGDKAQVKLQRHTACGDCGACHVSKSQLEVTCTAENLLGAKPGDFVEVDMENMDFLSAVAVIYILPLIALMIGVFAGYYAALAIGFTEYTSQGVGAVLGLLGAGLAYLGIRMNEDKIKTMKKYRPVVSTILEKQE